MDRMLVPSCSTIKVGVIKSAIEHEKAGMRRLASCPLVKVMRTGFYKDKPMYVRLRDGKGPGRRFEGIDACQREGIPDISSINQ